MSLSVRSRRVLYWNTREGTGEVRLLQIQKQDGEDIEEGRRRSGEEVMEEW